MPYETQKNMVQETKKLKAKISKLRQLCRKISDMMAERERLHQIGRDVLAEEACEFDKDKYAMAQSDIINRIMEYQEKIVNMEMQYEMLKQYLEELAPDLNLHLLCDWEGEGGGSPEKPLWVEEIIITAYETILWGRNCYQQPAEK